ncbi:MAG: 50S ribosomal protein L15 [Candidatus Nomurabacteria bacterium]|nr:MAG: 50S ribosomal protein L15 [Candidatus Nomurabacteria bacterium]
MTKGLHTLRQPKGAKSGKRRGRGHGSGLGTYSGRGMKGQRARTGGRQGTLRRTMKQLIARIPKTRGFSSGKKAATEVYLSQLNVFPEGSEVYPGLLKKQGIIQSDRLVKVIGNAGLEKRLDVKAHRFSEGARRAITEKGGKVVLLPLPIGPQPKRHQSS